MKKYQIDKLVSKISPYALVHILELFTRDQLRELARRCDIPQGRNKGHTIWNLMENRDEFADHIIEVTLL